MTLLDPSSFVDPPTGPPFPQIVAGQNAVGGIRLGTSQLGWIPPFNWWLTVVSQYANSPVLTGLLGRFFDAEDQTDQMQAFYDDMWNIDTAQGYGLDVWGRIVGVQRNVSVTAPTYIGTQQGGWATFGSGILYSGTLTTQNAALSDPAFKQLIFAQALANISNNSIPSINAALLTLFPGRGNCFVQDLGNMAMTYAFTFPLSPLDLAILNTGVLPRPTGVASSIVQGYPPGVTWDPRTLGSATQLTNQNLVALVASNPGAGVNGAASNWFQSSNKFYFEVQVQQWAARGRLRVGIGPVGSMVFGTAGTSLGNVSGSTGIAYSLLSGSIMMNGSAVGSMTPAAIGQFVGVAFDLNHMNIWFRLQGGLWNGSVGADPGSNIGGISIAGMPLPVYAWIDIEDTGPAVVQGNFGNLLYQSQAPPSFYNLGAF